MLPRRPLTGKAQDGQKALRIRDLPQECPVARTLARRDPSAAAPAERDRPRIAAEVVHHAGALSGAAGEEAVEAARGSAAAVRGAADDERRRVGQAADVAAVRR